MNTAYLVKELERLAQGMESDSIFALYGVTYQTARAAADKLKELNDHQEN